MSEQLWLIEQPAAAIDVYGGTKHPKNPCTPAPLGSGPAGETCGCCRHRVRVQHHDYFWSKCALMRHVWSHGAGTDIKARWLACREWRSATDEVS